MSSKRMREEGEKSSSNWPDLTPHRKAIRNKAAIEILAIIKMIITLIFLDNIAVKVFLATKAKDNKYQEAN